MTTADAHDPGPPATFAEAEAELESILAELEADAVDVDGLAAKVARAKVLLDACRAKVRAAEATIADLLEDGADGDTPPHGPRATPHEGTSGSGAAHDGSELPF